MSEKASKFRFRVVGPFGYVAAFPTHEGAEDYAEYMSGKRRGYYAVLMFGREKEPSLVAEFMSGVKVEQR